MDMNSSKKTSCFWLAASSAWPKTFSHEDAVLTVAQCMLAESIQPWIHNR
jgi:hypothetical protein